MKFLLLYLKLFLFLLKSKYLFDDIVQPEGTVDTGYDLAGPQSRTRTVPVRPEPPQELNLPSSVTSEVRMSEKKTLRVKIETP